MNGDTHVVIGKDNGRLLLLWLNVLAGNNNNYCGHYICTFALSISFSQLESS